MRLIFVPRCALGNSVAFSCCELVAEQEERSFILLLLYCFFSCGPIGKFLLGDILNFEAGRESSQGWAKCAREAVAEVLVCGNGSDLYFKVGHIFLRWKANQQTEVLQLNCSSSNIYI